MASDTDQTGDGDGDGRDTTEAPERQPRRALHAGRASRPWQGHAGGGTADISRPLGAGPASPRPGRVARGAGADPRAGARSDPLRPHARLAVHVLPRRRLPDGVGSGRRPAHRATHPALWRCPPVELRRLRRPRPQARLQPQRLRRDASRTLRVGRQAPRCELCGRRARSRLRREAAGRDQPGGRTLVPREHPHLRGYAEPRHLVLADRHRRFARPGSGGGTRKGRQGGEAARGERRQGQDEGQHEGVRQADGRPSTGSSGSSAIRR